MSMIVVPEEEPAMCHLRTYDDFEETESWNLPLSVEIFAKRERLDTPEWFFGESGITASCSTASWSSQWAFESKNRTSSTCSSGTSSTGSWADMSDDPLEEPQLASKRESGRTRQRRAKANAKDADASECMPGSRQRLDTPEFWLGDGDRSMCSTARCSIQSITSDASAWSDVADSLTGLAVDADEVKPQPRKRESGRTRQRRAKANGSA